MLLLFFLFFCCCFVIFFFFFQAEDGIRDLVRSRGLGDVYKRQVYNVYVMSENRESAEYRDSMRIQNPNAAKIEGVVSLRPVSYTHLTLPTSDLV